MTRSIAGLVGALAVVTSCAGSCNADETSTTSVGGTSAGGQHASGGGGGSDGDDDPPTITTVLAASEAIFLNPERGFYRTLSLVNDVDYQWVRDAGSTLAHSYVRLDDYRDIPLDDALLDAVAQGMAEARAAGIKIVLRFAYNFGPYPNSEPDASKSRVLEHLGQLAPLLEDNADVIAVMQAGFIGAWGEWHTSTNGLLDDPQDKLDILEAILEALPTERMVQLRYPPHKQEGYGAPLSATTAYDGGSASRVGHHNDCFLASDDDWGTYPSGEIDTYKTYLEQDTAFVAMGGETCNVNPPRSDCPTALEEMQRFHYGYVNHEYHPQVVDAWSTQGCRDEMQRRLGYRFTVVSVDHPEAVRPGGVFPLTVRLHNDGWAAPFNPRPVLVVLEGDARYQVTLPSADPRRWAGGQDAAIDVRLQLPADIAAGSYHLSLWLPDAAASLQGDSRYAIRLANDGVWRDADGSNRLVVFEVAPDAPGGSDPSAAELAVLP